MTKVIYTPGVCNIGPEEVKRRKTVGWVGLIATVIVIAALFYFPASKWLRLIVFVPAFVSAAGFIQAYFHFCVGFAQSGVYNFDTPGTTQAVTDPILKAKDVAHANRLYSYMVLIALVVTAIIFFI